MRKEKKTTAKIIIRHVALTSSGNNFAPAIHTFLFENPTAQGIGTDCQDFHSKSSCENVKRFSVGDGVLSFDAGN